MMSNFWRLRGIAFRTVSYAYVDHGSYLADALLEQAKIRVKYHGEMHREGSDYCVVFAKVRKRDAEKFERIMKKLEDKMLLLGYSDYGEACETIRNILEEGSGR